MNFRMECPPSVAKRHLMVPDAVRQLAAAGLTGGNAAGQLAREAKQWTARNDFPSWNKAFLAAELGTSSKTLSRTLERLRDQNLISVAAKAVTGRDVSALSAILRRYLGESV